MGIYDRIQRYQNSGADSNKTFKFSVTVNENIRQRLDNISEILDAPRSILAGELIDEALLKVESDLGLIPAFRDDGEYYPEDWTEQHAEYAKRFHPIMYFCFLFAKGEISKEEFFSKVKMDNGVFILRDGGNA